MERFQVLCSSPTRRKHVSSSLRLRRENTEHRFKLPGIRRANLVCWPYVIASVLATGKAPQIEKAIRAVPHGKQAGLRPTNLRGIVQIDPRKEDFFRRVVEERKKFPKDDPMEYFLKIFASFGSYGLFVEVNQKELEGTLPDTKGRLAVPFSTRGRAKPPAKVKKRGSGAGGFGVLQFACPFLPPPSPFDGVRTGRDGICTPGAGMQDGIPT
jgi:hypothetical protein